MDNKMIAVTKEDIEIPQKRIVYMTVGKGKRVLLPCDIAHQIRELIETNAIGSFGYEIGDLEDGK
jgi:hypothetical protein